jgi:hypothetical protein
MDEYFETSPKKGRGRAKRSLDLIAAMHAIAKAASQSPAEAWATSYLPKV